MGRFELPCYKATPPQDAVSTVPPHGQITGCKFGGFEPHLVLLLRQKFYHIGFAVSNLKMPILVSNQAITKIQSLRHFQLC